MSWNILGKAVEQAKAAATAAKADDAKQQQATDAAARWKQIELTMENALEHAGISGIDVQIDSNGFARMLGEVATDGQLQTASAIAEQFEISGLDMQLKIVAPEADETDQSSIWSNAATEAVTYKTKKGDSWWGIAQKFYSDGTQWKRLKRANGWPKMLHPNVDLKIPNADELQKFPEE